MGILENEQATKKAIRDKLPTIINADIQKMSRTQDLGSELGYTECVPLFERIIDLYRQVESAIEMSELSFNALNQINARCDNTNQLFRVFTDFSLTQNTNRNLVAERAQNIQNVINHYNEIFDALSPYLAYCNTKDTKIARLQAQAEESVAEMKRGLMELAAVKEEANSTLTAVKTMAEEAGVSQYAGIFAAEARAHQISARWWLGATITVTAVTTGFGYYFFKISLDPTKVYVGAQAVQTTVAKVALLSILFTATIWVGRFYRSHRHNTVINKHRSNALRTFETFAKATKDESTKNAVLIKATECIFSQQPTGYTAGETETGGAAQIVEIVRGMTGKTG